MSSVTNKGMIGREIMMAVDVLVVPKRRRSSTNFFAALRVRYTLSLPIYSTVQPRFNAVLIARIRDLTR